MTTYMDSGLTQRTLQGALTLRFALALITSVLVTAAVSVPMAVVALRAQGSETGANDYQAPAFEPLPDDELQARQTRIIQPPAVEVEDGGVAPPQVGTPSGTTIAAPLDLEPDQTPDSDEDEEVALSTPEATLKRGDNDREQDDDGDSNDGDGDDEANPVVSADSAGAETTTDSKTDAQPATLADEPTAAEQPAIKTLPPVVQNETAAPVAGSTEEVATPATPVTTATSVPIAALSPVGASTSGTPATPSPSSDDTQTAAPAPASGTGGGQAGTPSAGGGQVGTLSAPTAPNTDDGFVTVDNLNPANLPPVTDITDTDPDPTPPQSGTTTTTTVGDTRAGDPRAGRPASYSTSSTTALSPASTTDPEPELLAPSGVLLTTDDTGQSFTDTDTDTE